MEPWMYLVLLGLIIVVYARFAPKSAKTDSSEMVKEIENTLDHFSLEMEEENRKLLQLVSQMKKEHDQQIDKLWGRIELLEEQLDRELADMKRTVERYAQEEASRKDAPQIASVLASKPVSASPESGTGRTAVSVADEAEASNPAESPAANLRSRYAELFQLYEQGKSTDYIAKKLGMNKGEVILIMQLAKQEEQLRA